MQKKLQIPELSSHTDYKKVISTRLKKRKDRLENICREIQ